MLVRDLEKEGEGNAEAVNRGSFIFHFITMCLHMVYLIHNNKIMGFMFIPFLLQNV